MNALAKPASNSVAVPVIEYRVITECGRIFSWSATSPESAIYEIKRDKGLTALMVTPFTDGFEQLELNSEHEGADTAA